MKMFRTLVENRYGYRLRLEQERVPFERLQSALAAIVKSHPQ